MGRFASAVEFYTRCRESYPPEFFQTVADGLALRGDEALLDIGCGPGPLAIGFAPFVGSCTGLDPEADMIEAARAAAEAAGMCLTLHLGRIEDFPTGQIFDVVTLGRALHWLDRDTTLQVLERIVFERGHVLICGATSIEVQQSEWLKPYLKICNSWSDDPERKRYRIEAQEWFTGSRFSKLDDISVTHAQDVSIDDMIGRALSKSNTSPEVLGECQAEFEAEIRSALEPFSQDGELQEEIVANAAVFGRATL
jgi:SAM-dependent methyltransferase